MQCNRSDGYDANAMLRSLRKETSLKRALNTWDLARPWIIFYTMQQLTSRFLLPLASHNPFTVLATRYLYRLHITFATGYVGYALHTMINNAKDPHILPVACLYINQSTTNVLLCLQIKVICNKRILIPKLDDYFFLSLLINIIKKKQFHNLYIKVESFFIWLLFLKWF